VLLIIEDDVKFARILLSMARDKGFKGVVALEAETGLALARKLKPDAITLDIRLPDMDGWAVLDRLKHNAETSHIPVHILSVLDDQQRGLNMGALAYLTKPVSKESLDGAFSKIKGFLDRKVKRLLVVEDNEVQRSFVVSLIGNGDVQTTAVGTGAEALAALRAEPFDCVVLDLKLPDMTGFELLARSRQEPGIHDLPVVVYTGKSLTLEEQAELAKWTEAVVLKDAQSPERLLAETSLFLHRVETNLPESKQKMLRQVHDTDPLLANKKVLIVDDDLRNIFALTAVLERSHMQVPYAENGKDALKILQTTPGIDLVLMDIMMPEMDGYETMRRIRVMEQFKSLPIIALTAKAMKGDREKCIEAGASDYVAKPVGPEQLLSLVRVWLYR